MPWLPTSIHSLLVFKCWQRGDLGCLSPTLQHVRAKEWPLHGVSNLHKVSLLPRHRPPHIEQIPTAVDLDDPQVLHRHPVVPHPPRHLLPLEHPARILALSRRAQGAVRPRRSVRRGHAAEAPPLHSALKSLPLADPGDVHLLPGNEVPRVDARAGGRHGVLGRDSKLPHEVRRMLVHAVPAVELEQRAVHVLPLPLSGAELDGTVPVLLDRLVLEDDVRVEEQDRARMALAPLVPDGHHPHLDPERAAPLVP
mmetsp:Transcript_10811/g.20605  ORF Transcript_10811/g.20605 Transcript_10811/m.20605 type:complete len:253 (-) Transcript_10811:227-985(-)